MNCVFRHIEKRQEESIKSLKREQLIPMFCVYISNHI